MRGRLDFTAMAKILDLYSLQDAIPQFQEDGYHGYAARAGDIVLSLRKVLEWNPDVLIPARGPLIREPKLPLTPSSAASRGLFASHFRC